MPCMYRRTAKGAQGASDSTTWATSGTCWGTPRVTCGQRTLPTWRRIDGRGEDLWSTAPQPDDDDDVPTTPDLDPTGTQPEPQKSSKSHVESDLISQVTYRTSGDRMDPRVSVPMGLLVLGVMATCVTGQEQPVYLTTAVHWEFYKVPVVGKMSNTNIRTTCLDAGMRYSCWHSGVQCTRWWTLGCPTYDDTSIDCRIIWYLTSFLCGNVDPEYCQPLDDIFVYIYGLDSRDSSWGINYDTNQRGLYGADYSNKYALCAVAPSCEASPCLHGNCTDVVGGSVNYNCTCESGWGGSNCDQITCEASPCSEHGTCTDGDEGYICTCENRWGGRNCDEPPDVYLHTYNNWAFYKVRAIGTMTNANVKTACEAVGMRYPCYYTGPTSGCTYHWTTGCITYSKQPVGVCETLRILQQEICGVIYEWGNHCEALDDTFVYHHNYFNNIGAFGNDYDLGKTYMNGVNYENMYALCAVATSCVASPCEHGTCADAVGDLRNYTCTCESGWAGIHCDQEVIDECADGTHDCHTHATCTDTPGGFTCTCNAGYSGDGNTCTDHCDPNPCQNGGVCNNTGDSYTCECVDGWGGPTCETDHCDPNPCQNGGVCSSAGESYTCECADGWGGTTCETGLSDLTFSDIEMDRMTVSWTASADLDITRYRLRYRHAGASYQDLSPPPAPGDTTAIVRGLWADTEYNFTLTAFGEDDEQIGEISGTETTAEVIVNVDCHQDHMSVTFPVAALTEVDVESLHLVDENCRSTISETDPPVVTLRTGLQECGTTQEVSSQEKLIFSNEVFGSPVVHENGAMRGAPFSKKFQCEFVRQYVVSQDQNILFNIPPPRVQVRNAENQFTFEMHMFPSADFADTYTSDDYPVQVTPSDQLHFGLSVDSPLDNLELFALHCLATPSDDPEASPSVNIIQEGCHIDTTLQLNNALSNDMALYYSIQSFTFPNVEPPSLVYIHCTMVVCFKDNPDSRCSDGCIPARRRRRAVSDMSDARVRRASETDETVTISQGPFKVVGGEKQASAVPTVGIAVGTAAGIAGVLLMVVAVFLVRKRRGRDVKEQVEDRVGFDNYSFELWGKGKTANVTPKPE
ncbi:PREDICTED: uncharacterized protein LOC109485145 [Branchiostoma belcheri]|uniref:Uncharacterized protein LOC109485145 n=1 Tax=Branchiostoma belcheri TaxID=7741 RepID=A0A6P5AQ14_BRABE|nr:PREDICTED: uncharacterized protein LOC109485145 [Branchiostoma belcheri]